MHHLWAFRLTRENGLPSTLPAGIMTAARPHSAWLWSMQRCSSRCKSAHTGQYGLSSNSSKHGTRVCCGDECKQTMLKHDRRPDWRMQASARAEHAADLCRHGQGLDAPLRARQARCLQSPLHICHYGSSCSLGSCCFLCCTACCCTCTTTYTLTLCLDPACMSPAHMPILICQPCMHVSWTPRRCRMT